MKGKIKKLFLLFLILSLLSSLPSSPFSFFFVGGGGGSAGISTNQRRRDVPSYYGGNSSMVSTGSDGDGGCGVSAGKGWASILVFPFLPPAFLFPLFFPHTSHFPSPSLTSLSSSLLAETLPSRFFLVFLFSLSPIFFHFIFYPLLSFIPP